MGNSGITYGKRGPIPNLMIIRPEGHHATLISIHALTIKPLQRHFRILCREHGSP